MTNRPPIRSRDGLKPEALLLPTSLLKLSDTSDVGPGGPDVRLLNEQSLAILSSYPRPRVEGILAGNPSPRVRFTTIPCTARGP